MKQKYTMRITSDKCDTEVNIVLHENYLPLYNGERRVELPEEVFKELFAYYKQKSNTKMLPKELIVTIMDKHEKEPLETIRYRKVHKREYVSSKEVNKYFFYKSLNTHHTTRDNKIHVAYPRFIKVKKINEEDAPYALEKIFSSEEKIKNIFYWKNIFEWLFSKTITKKELVRKIVCRYKLYATNVIPALDYYNVYIEIVNLSEKEYVKTTIIKKSWNIN